MLKVIKNKILINRGDTGILAISTKNDDGSSYEFKVGDVIRFTITKANDCSDIIKRKDVIVENESTEVDIELLPEDTKIGEIISRPVDYWYEVELNPDTSPQTIIGYDEKGPKILKLYPEGGDTIKLYPEGGDTK